MFAEKSKEQREVSMNNLDLIVHYCDNMMDCRRSVQLDYFGEHFSREECQRNKASACDNCSRTNQFKETDATDICKVIVSAVKEFCMDRNRNTVLQMVELFKGAVTKRILESNMKNTKFHGHLKHWDRSDIKRIFHKLIIENYLREEIIIVKDQPQSYVRIGPKVAQLMTPGAKTKIMFAVTEKNQPKAKKVEVTKADDEDDELYERCYHDLMDVAQRIANERSLTVGQVMNMQAIREMSRRLPATETDMLQIPHVTKANFDKYGKRFMDITGPYAAQRAINEMDKTEEEDSDNQEEDWIAMGRDASSSTSRTGSGTKRKFTGNYGHKGKKRYKGSGKGKKKSPAKKRTASKPSAKTAAKNLLPRPTPQF